MCVTRLASYVQSLQSLSTPPPPPSLCSEAVYARVRVCGHDGTQWPLLKKQISAEGWVDE